MPGGLSEDGEAGWLLCRASVWPDQIRNDRENEPTYPPLPAKQGSYHRGIWHYIDTPLVIVADGTSDERVKALEEKARGGQDLATDIPKDEKQVRNAIQAIAFNRERFVHGSPEEKAVALCWLLHLAGDIHQPLHATAAFTTGVLDPDSHPHGDAGGNAIRLAEGRNLHALWDAAPDDSPDASFDPGEPFDQRYNRAYARALKQIDSLLGNTALELQGKRAARENDPKQWSRESFQLAKTEVYAADIRKQLLAADRVQKSSDDGVPVQLPAGYRNRAHEIGKLRVVEAGWRTARLLNDVATSIKMPK